MLVALGPLSRVGDPGGGTAGPAGVALLAPDSLVYLDRSASWSALVGTPWTRWGYLIVLRLGDLAGDAATVTVAVQFVATWAAGIGLLRLGRRLAGPTAGVVAAAALLLNPMTAQWTRFVLTEPLFYALAVGVVVVATDTGRPRRRRTLLLLAAAALLLRPTGPLLAGAAVLLAVADAPWSTGIRRTLAAVAVGGTVVLLVAGAVATGPPAEASFADQLRDGVVVEGTPEVRTTIAMPADAADDGPAAYVAAHPAAVARLAVARVAVEVAQVRRHYPAVVNAGLATAMLVLVALAAAGLREPRGRRLRLPTAVVLLPLVGITAVTFAVPEGRYGWAGLVALTPAVGVGAAALRERLRPQAAGGTAR